MLALPVPYWEGVQVLGFSIWRFEATCRALSVSLISRSSGLGSHWCNDEKRKIVTKAEKTKRSKELPATHADPSKETEQHKMR
jgi:hypothetical protein